MKDNLDLRGNILEQGLKYTLCFIKRGDEILMLNRNYPTWMGSWNGVGGRMEDGESPKECILREVFEETGIKLSDARDCGALTWRSEGNGPGGSHLFLAEVPKEFHYDTPRGMEEGILDWKKTSWIYHPENTGVIKNIQRFLPIMINDKRRYNHACVYEGYTLKEFSSLPMRAE